jgi:hypothetical protein
MADSDVEDEGTGGAPRPFVSQLCFVRHGEDSSASRKALLEELLQFSTKSPVESISDAGIKRWFLEEGRGPRLAKSKRFVKAYLESTYSDKMDHDRIQAYLILQSLCETGDDDTSSKKIRLAGDDQLHINIADIGAKMLHEGHVLCGLYVTYKARFRPNQIAPFAQEVLYVYLIGNDLRFKHWYVRSDETIAKFEGSVLPLAHLTWFFGISDTLPERVRVLCFRRTGDYYLKNEDRHRWGIVTSDVPLPEGHEPAASRILLNYVGQAPEEAVDAWARQNVRHLTVAELPSGSADLIKRLIRNDVAARSNPDTIDPATSRSGEPLIDTVLKVDQTTMNEAGPLLQSSFAPPVSDTST